MSNAIIESQLKMRADEVSSILTYIGYAAPKAVDSASVWRIVRVTVSGTVTSIEYANGDNRFANRWDQRASLSYS